MGYDIRNVGNIDMTLVDMKRSAASKVLSILFRGEFKNTLQKIAKDESYVTFVKDHLNQLMSLISDKKYSHVIGQILQMFTSYNKELGDWIISRLLDIDCNSRQVTLLLTLTKCNPRRFLGRLQIIKNFIFEHVNSLTRNTEIQNNQLTKLQPFMETFIDLVTIFSKNLQIQSWCDEVIPPEESKNLQKYNTKELIGMNFLSHSLL